MPTPAERVLQNTVASIAWQAIVEGMDTSAVIRTLNLLQAQLVAEHVRANAVTAESALAQLGVELQQITMAILGATVASAAAPPPKPKRRR
jgi:hypothetical protein